MRKAPTICAAAVLCLLSAFTIKAVAEPAFSTADTTIGELIDNPQTLAILDKHVPGLSTNSSISMARGMTLQAIEPFSQGAVTDEVLAKIDADLAKLPAEKK